VKIIMPRRNTVICREGWYYLLVLAFVACGSILRDVNLLMVISGMMLFPLFLNWRSAVGSLKGLVIERRLPASIGAGDLLRVDLEIEKQPRFKLLSGKTSWCVRIEETIRHRSTWSTMPPKTTSLFCWRIQSGQTARLSYRARLLERGIYRIGPARISSGFPLGLVRHTRAAGRSDEIVVFPHCGNLTPQFQTLFQESQIGMRGNPAKQDRQTGDFHGLRDWREGDERRLIHWRSTARRGTPVVRQFEQQRQQDLNLVVDLHQDAPGNRTEMEILEYAIRFAATIVTDYCQRGDSYLRLSLSGSEAASHGGASSLGLLPQLLTMLATAGGCREDRLGERLGEWYQRHDPRRPTLILSPRKRDIRQLSAEAGFDDQLRGPAGPIRCIHTGSEELWEFFDPVY
jgi:uncharacterized protein (DUF58 family)